MYGWAKSEAQFLNWLRSNLRKIWSQHPAKVGMLQDRRFLKATNTGRRIWHVKCESCKKDYKMADVEVNHKKQVGRLSKDNIGEHVENLLMVTTADLEILCKACHSVVTYSERSGMTMEDAAIEKKVIEFTKKPAEFQKKKLTQLGIDPGKTAGIRRAQAREFLKSKEKQK
jgi:hypothetical protein